MSKRDELLQELETLSEPMIAEVIDFVQFLKQKDSVQARDLALASEALLARDWLTPEEDKAWAQL
jgi:hypothetical protein